VKRINIFCLIFFSISFLGYSQPGGEIPKKETTLSFTENKGQVGDQFSRPRPDVIFTGNSGNLVFHLRSNGISYQMYRVDKWRNHPSLALPPSTNAQDKLGERTEQHQERDARERSPAQKTIYRLDINWLHANPNAAIKKENVLEGYDNYYSEVCPNGVTGVKSYKNITYQNLYSGIDLKWYENEGNLEYDYIVAPGVDHRQIQLEIKGAENISINKNGELIIKTPLGTVIEKSPYVTQNGKVLKAKWIINESIVSFHITDVDPTKQLVIDPLVRLWGTYYGGNLDEKFLNSVVDASGNIYVSGQTDSQNNIATAGAHQTINGGGPSDWSDDAILVKFNSAGTRLWSTYYGGTGGEYGQDCAVDPTGNSIAMVGGTSTTLTGVIATPGTHQPNYAGNTSNWSGDAFLVLFNSAGVRQWGTYYGGPADEWGLACDFDINGDIYIAGGTISSSGIATPGAHQTIWGGLMDGYIAKFNNTGTRLWGTYYGDTNWDIFRRSSSDSFGNVYVVGYARSKNNIATPGALQTSIPGLYGAGDAMIVKFNSSGVRQWGTYYGCTGEDDGYCCSFDATSGNLYVSGSTCGAYPLVSTPGSHQPTFGGGTSDAYLLKLTSAGTRQWCTFYGGSGNERVSTNDNDYSDNWCSVDPSGYIYLGGSSSSTNNISTLCSYQINYAGKSDAYLSKFNPDGIRLWGTYYGGGSYDDYSTGSTDLSGNVYIVGWTDSPTSIASPGSHQPVFGGGNGDGFLVKFDGCIPNAPNTTDPSKLKICQGKTSILTTDSSCNISWFDVPTGGLAIANTSAFTTPDLSTTTTYYVNEASCGSNTIRTAITVTVNPPPLISVDLSPTLLCYKTSLIVKASGAASYTWSPDKWISCTNCSDPVLSPHETMEYCVEGVDNNSCMNKTCVTVEVNLARDHNFSLPNAFTPNGDGQNDSFCLQGWAICNDDFLIRIFDRWGEKVFESNDPNFCWDGFYNGKLLNADVFVYSVSATYKDETKVNKKGNITLIR